MKNTKMGKIWQTLIKRILNIFIEKPYSKFPSHPLKEDSSIGGEGVTLETLLSYQTLG